jgi:hypothetical protein
MWDIRQTVTTWARETVRIRCHGTAGKDTAGSKRLAGVVVIFELWRSAVAL